jgi:hypothetical protein
MRCCSASASESMLSPCGLPTTRTLNSCRYDAYARITENVPTPVSSMVSVANPAGANARRAKATKYPAFIPSDLLCSCAVESFRRASFALSSDERKSKCPGYDRSRTSHVDKSNPEEGVGNLHARACRRARLNSVRDGRRVMGCSILQARIAPDREMHLYTYILSSHRRDG